MLGVEALSRGAASLVCVEKAPAALEVLHANLAALAGAGATIGFGTDAGFCFAQHGMVDDELVQMQRAGMDAHAVLRAATVGLSGVLDRPDLGWIRTGAPADLVLLDVDPRDDLRSFADPVAVVRGGRVVLCGAAAPPELCTGPRDRRASMARAAWFGLNLALSL